MKPPSIGTEIPEAGFVDAIPGGEFFPSSARQFGTIEAKSDRLQAKSRKQDFIMDTNSNNKKRWSNDQKQIVYDN